MHPNVNARRLFWGLVALCLMVGGTVKAQPVDRSGTVIVPVGGAVRLQMKSKKPIKEVFNEKPTVVAVEADAANPAYVILRGVAQGTSRIELMDADKGKEAYEVVVQTDIDLLRNILRRAVPTANVEIIPFGTGVVLSGHVARVDDIDTILRISGTVLGAQNVVNALTVGGVHQVQLDVTVARVDRSKLRQRGFNIIVNGKTVSAGSVLGGLTSSSSTSSTSSGGGAAVGIIPSAASAAPTSAANLVLGIVPAQIQTLLQALKTENLAKLLAEPKLVTQSGRPARFLAGGRQATLSSASGINGPGVTYEDIGTELEFLPIVYGNGKIYLEVAPRVRSVNQGLGITTTFGTVPGFDEQSIRTSVVLESGQTFAVAGLIQTTVSASNARVPVLGEIPFIGAFFSVTSYNEDEQELVVLVTPHLVDAMDCNQVPLRLPGRETRGPDDYELYLESILEAPRGQRNVFDGHYYRAAWKNDPTAAVYPCGMNGGGLYGDGACGGFGNCATGNCAPAPRGAAAVKPMAPADLPSAVNSPMDPIGPPRDR
jgi:pilus assembly protein CpaC